MKDKGWNLIYITTTTHRIFLVRLELHEMGPDMDYDTRALPPLLDSNALR